jgi:ankyrin repeat protein
MDEAWRRAALTDDVATIDRLLESGADVDARDRYGQTALMLAAPRGHEAAVRRLIEAGADLDVTAKYGLSALMLAVVNHQGAVARALAAAGADLTLRGTGQGGFFDKTAADLARGNGQAALAGDLERRAAGG